MGSSASKASKVAGAAARQYPTRPPTSTSAPRPPAPPPPRPEPRSAPGGPTNRPAPQAFESRSEAINSDASDPDFARSLRSIGPVQPNPTLSNTSVFNNPGQTAPAVGPDPRKNPAIVTIDARSRLQDGAEREFMEAGRRGHGGREFLDVFTIRQMLVLRDERGKTAAEIEKALGLKKGVVDGLGTGGVVELAQETGRAQREVDMV